MKVIYRVHAIQRMFERSITTDDILNVIETGETIETYPQDLPYPSRLVLGWLKKRPIHVVLAENADLDEKIVITAYEPDSLHWEAGFKRRKK